MIKEACVGSLEDALKAQKNGANRIELCDNLLEGGTTPSYGCIKKCLEYLSIPVFVMIRPRGGNFEYTDIEVASMKEDIFLAKKLGVPGVVFGALTKDKKLDMKTLSELVETAKPMEITFHKAIDELEDPFCAIPELINLGFSRILSSGKRDTALEGVDTLNRMITIADRKLTLVVAGKVTSKNLDLCASKIKAVEFHGKKIVPGINE